MRLQSLLPDDDSIHFLIGGINNDAIRSTATVIRADSLDTFLYEMHKVTLSFGNSMKKDYSSHSKSQKVRDNGASTAKSDFSAKSQKDLKDNYCVYCRARDHNRSNCFKLKKKEQFQTPVPISSTPVAAIDSSTSTPIAIDSFQ